MAEQHAVASRGGARLGPPACDDRAMWDVWLSAYHFPALTVADELDLFPLLARAPASAAEVAAGLTIGSRGAEALLGVLAGLGLLVVRRGRFHLTEVARTYLLPDSPYYYGGLLRIYRDVPMTHAALRDALRQDKPFAREEYGEVTRAWEAADLPPEQAAAITALRHSHSFPAAMGIARWGDFAGVRRLLDVGGGSGCFGIALALRYPDLRCTVMELPTVCAQAERYVAEYGLQDRITTLAANMFTDEWPSDYDAVLFSNILHDWDPASCRRLARRAFEALPPDGRIYVHEMLLADARDAPLVATTFSLLMLWATRGKQFTAGELDELLRETGFSDVSVTPTCAYYSLLSARKPESP